jgi:hypothetical protein
MIIYKKQTSNPSRKQISRMNKVKGHIFHIEVATNVHGFRQQVVEYFNGKHSIELYPNTIQQPGTLQKIAFDLESDTKIFEITIIDVPQTTTHAIDFLKHHVQKQLICKNNKSLKYRFIEYKKATLVPNRTKFTVIKTPNNIGHSENSSDFSCRSLSSNSIKSNSSKYSNSSLSNDSENQLFRKMAKLLDEYNSIQKQNANKSQETYIGMAFTFYFNFQFIIDYFYFF